MGVSLSSLAGAVAREGGIGIISTAQIGFREPDFDTNPIGANIRAIESEIRKARNMAPGGVIGVNIMVATKPYEEYVKAAVQSGADLIISGAGLPLALPTLVEGSRTKIAPIVSSAKSASVICRMWDRKNHRAPDLVVIEGPKAGGHLGFSLEQLKNIEQMDYDQEVLRILEVVREFEDKYDRHIPVVAAGGIYTREDMEHYLKMGLDGVQMATRFVTTPECDAHERYKQCYLDAEEGDIVLVKSPVGMPGRAIQNRFLREVQEGRKKPLRCHQCLEHCDPAEIPYCITDALIQAVTGNVEEGLLFCGSNAVKSKKMETVHDILTEFA